MIRSPSRALAAFGLLLCMTLSARADFNADVQSILADRLLSHATVGIEVDRLGNGPTSGKLLFQHDADLPLIPASNLKLITTSAVLDRLGVDFKFRTLLVRHGNDLILIGDGDPTLGDAKLYRHVGWDVTQVFANWADGLKKRGINSVGNVLVDDSVFDEAFSHPHWPANQADDYYLAEVGGVNFDVNCLDFSVQPSGGGLAAFKTDPPTHYVSVRNTCQSGGSNAIGLVRLLGTNNIVLSGSCPFRNQFPITVHDPPLYAGTVLAETLAAAGIKVTGKVSRDRTIRAALTSNASAADASWTLLAVHETPLPLVVARTNKDSMNMYAESLCKRLGFAVTGQSGSWANGTAAVGAFLAKVGVDERLYHLDDGCGLSKENVIAAHAIVSVLTYDYFARHNQAFFNSMSVAGTDGTLEKRFEGSDLRGRVFGKTGFVNKVSALSGYLHARDDQWYVFSILMNGIPAGSNSEVKPLQEQIIKALDQSVGRGAPMAVTR